MRRGVKDVDTRCPVCMGLDEDGGHYFFKCKQVKRCWQALQLEAVRLQLLSMKSAREVVHHILQMKDKEQNLVISCLWVWWDTRNKKNAGEHAGWMEEVIHRTTAVAFGVDLLNMQKKEVLPVAR